MSDAKEQQPHYEPIRNWKGEVVGYRRVEPEQAIDATHDTYIYNSKGEEGET